MLTGASWQFQQCGDSPGVGESENDDNQGSQNPLPPVLAMFPDSDGSYQRGFSKAV
jgi:hypothetical protein